MQPSNYRENLGLGTFPSCFRKSSLRFSMPVPLNKVIAKRTQSSSTGILNNNTLLHPSLKGVTSTIHLFKRIREYLYYLIKRRSIKGKMKMKMKNLIMKKEAQRSSQ